MAQTARAPHKSSLVNAARTLESGCTYLLDLLKTTKARTSPRFGLAGVLMLLCTLPSVTSATGIPLDGFLPQVGFTLTNQYSNELDFFPAASAQPSGTFLGDPGGLYDIALLDTGAAISLITTPADSRFQIDSQITGDGQGDGFRGTETIVIGGASGTLEASIGDPLGLHVAGLQDRISGGPVLTMNNPSMRGQTNSSIVTVPMESDLPNVVGLPFASQYTMEIRNSVPQIFELDGETVRSPLIEFRPLGSGGLGISRKAQLKLLGDSPSTPLHFPNLGNLDIDHPNENPSQPTVVQGGHFLDVNLSNDGASLSSEFFFDTGASVTVLSAFRALDMGFDVVTDEPDFSISIVGSGGILDDIPGFFIDELSIPALGGNITVQNVPVIVLDIVNVSNPGNIVDGIVGTNIFQGRDIVIDPHPSLGGGGPSPGLYVSDPVTNDFDWASTTATASWSTPASWTTNDSATDFLSIANIRHLAGGNQTGTLTQDADAFEVNVSGGAGGETMTLRVENDAKLTTFSGVNAEIGGVVSLGGATLDVQFVDIRGGRLEGSGTIRTGSGSIGGQVENVGGVVVVGDGIGTLSVEGRFSNSNTATIEFDIGGITPGTQHDQLAVDGGVSIAGNLVVNLVDLDGSGVFSPINGDSFLIIAGTESLAGEFDNLTLPGLQGNFIWDVDYSDGSVRLTVESPTGLECDADGDGRCDHHDIDEMYSRFGTSNQLFDYDGNGTVDEDDIPGWLAAASSPQNPAKPSSVDIFVLGDVNLDGNVDSDDLGQVLNKFNDTSQLGWGLGNLNGDAMVDSVDLGTVLNKFNFTSAAAASVPEPGSLVLLLMGLGVFVRFARSRD